MPTTLKDVAREAGVSIAAVSKVLHGRGQGIRVSESKAEHIRQVATELSYYPNALARSLQSQTSHTVGLIFEQFGEISAGPLYYVYLLDGVASALFPRHYRLTILPEIENGDALATLGDRRLDGAIWCKLDRDGEVRSILQRSPIPLVALNAPPPLDTGDTVYVSCDNEGGAKLAVDHLVELGHRRILFVKELEEEATPDAVARYEGFRQALRSQELPVYENDFETWSPNCEEFGAWRQSKAPHTAIFAWNERMAGEILKRAAEYGASIPGELSVVGFDSTQYCETTTPRLTAVRQPIKEMAKHATELLLAMIEGNRPDSTTYTFPCTLDVRDTTAIPISKTRQLST
ncbi:MAG TPA: LacI family DNA-binding transcriptional regulator [Fimbriimonas sp.]|nr:LacI family DNA-binding transcriptional regulator [Fimbriimonas sp.]